MAHQPFGVMRWLQYVIPGFVALIGVLAFVGGVWPAGLVILGLAGVFFLLFQLRFRAHRRNTTRVRAGLEQLGKTSFDAPAAVEVRGPDDHAETLASSSAFARMIARRSTRVFVRGKSQGRELELGTAVVAARDWDQYVSYACAVDAAPRAMFRAMTRGALTRLARIGMDKREVATGDKAFDDAWVVDADEATARAVLDDATRARLMELQKQMPMMMVASVEATPRGLVVRFPTELSAEWAANLRELAFSMHDRLATVR